jgi:hypothetical protein
MQEFAFSNLAAICIYDGPAVQKNVGVVTLLAEFI